MNGFTPGPWRVSGAYVIGDAGVIVRQAAAYDAAPNDLRLIAAAPELLAMCQRILGHPLIHITGDVEIPLKRAIAKATGGQP